MSEENNQFTRECKDGPGIQPDDPIFEAGRKIFLYQFGLMRAEEQDLHLESSIEPLHKMRVAVRRMRMAYRVLGENISKKVMETLIQDLSKLGDALGTVRDLDVLLMNAEAHKKTLIGERQNDFERLVGYLDRVRGGHRKEVIERLDSRWYQSLCGKLDQILNAPQVLIEGEPNKSYQTLPTAQEIIQYRYKKVLEFDPFTGSDTIGRFHKLRIRVKALRYSVEFFEEILGIETRVVIGTLIKLQDYLGGLNDAAVACGFLENLMKDNSFQNLSHESVLDETAEYLAQKRGEVENQIENFPSVWEEIHRPAFQDPLRKLLL
jgi:CHAD domain-containing protein